MNDPKFLNFLLEKGYLNQKQLTESYQEFYQEEFSNASSQAPTQIEFQETSKPFSSFDLEAKTQLNIPPMRPSLPTQIPKLEQKNSTTESNTPSESFNTLFKALEKETNDTDIQQNPAHSGEEQTVLEIPSTETVQISPLDLTQESSHEERYKVLKTLGEGGMGVVQLAQDSLLKREVALKRIKVPQMDFSKLTNKQKMMLWRLNREAEITAVLEHPNIVPLYDMQKKLNGEIQFTMRKIEGETFAQILKERKQHIEENNEQKILSIFQKVCDALSYAHDQGFVHRDLKPDNIMVGKFGEVYVMDWGIAKKIEKENQTNLETTENNSDFDFFNSEKALIEGVEEISSGILEESSEEKTVAEEEGLSKEQLYKTVGAIGTPGYMAPEQQSKTSLVCPQTDVYALGTILRQCFVLMSPLEELHQRVEISYNKNDKNEVSKRIKEYEEELNKKIPRDILAIVEKATHQTTTSRYKNAQELGKDIERYGKNNLVSAREYSALEALEKWVLRNKQKVILVAVLLLSLAGFGLHFSLAKQKERQQFFDQFYTLYQAEKQKAEQFKGTGRRSIENKMQLYLNAISFLDRAALAKEGDPEIEQENLNLITNIVDLSFKTKDFQLAQFVAKQLEEFETIQETTKINLQKKVATAKNAQLQLHQKRFNWWVNRLQSPQQFKEEHEEAIFEISKMQEEEIYNKLLDLLQKGIDYFLTSPYRTTLLDNFYGTMAVALGRLENSQASLPLLQSLQKLEKELTQKYQEKKPLAETRFMIKLTQAISYTRAPHIFDPLSQIRFKMGYNGVFWKETEAIFQKLASEDLSTLVIPESAERCIEMGMNKHAHSKFNEALSYYNIAIEKDPKQPKSYLLKGLIYFEKQNYLTALENFDRALLLPDDSLKAKIYIYQAKTFEKLNQIDKVWSHFEKAIQEEPKLTKIYYHRALLYLKTSNLEKAFKRFKSNLITRSYAS